MKTLKIMTTIVLLTTLSMAQKEALLIGVSDYQGTQSDLGGITPIKLSPKNIFSSSSYDIAEVDNQKYYA